MVNVHQLSREAEELAEVDVPDYLENGVEKEEVRKMMAIIADAIYNLEASYRDLSERAL